MGLALVVGAATLCSLLLLRYAGLAANLGGFLVGALAGPVLLVGFLIVNESRGRSGRFGDWRWLPSRPTVSVVALIGWVAGAAHVWFLAKEITRWLAG